MSNNKQSMKLYTEEQLMKTWNTAFTEALKLDEEDYMPTFYGEFINGLTHIELPTDEEIKKTMMDFDEFDPDDVAYLSGAIWMRDKIQGGNK